MVKPKSLWCTVILLLILYVLLQVQKQSVRTRTSSAKPVSEWSKDMEPAFCDSILKNEENICHEQRNIAFIKTHKTGSTTVMNILQRFGFTRNLTFVLPRDGLVYLGPHKTTLKPWLIRPPPKNKSFNILCNHVVYNKQAFGRIMPNNSVYISIVRHPFERFRSAFWYYSYIHPQEYLGKIKGGNKLKEFLKEPVAHERGVEYTNNGMAFDLGLAPIFFHNRLKTLEYISNIDLDFTLVLVLEYFDESLVLLKRKFCWSLTDILYIPKNKRLHLYQRNTFPDFKVTKIEEERHRKWDQADFRFYNHFHEKLVRYINKEGEDFLQEVRHFKRILKKVSQFCTDKYLRANMAPCLHLPESPFNRALTVSWSQCELMLIDKEEKFTRKLIQRQYT